MARTRRWLLAGLVLLAVAAGIVLTLLLSPRGIRIVLTPSQLQAACDRCFPVSRRYLDHIDFTYHDPSVSISAGDDRVHLVVPMSAVIFGHALQGAMRGSFCLRYDAQTGALFLDRLLVEQLTINQVSPKLLARMAPFASELLAQHLQTHPVYVLQGSPARDLERLVIRRVQVSQGNLVLTLGR